MPLILGTNSIKDTGYEVANSLRFNSGSSDKLSKTFSSAGNRKTFTISTWIKRASSSGRGIIDVYSDGSNYALIQIGSDEITAFDFDGSSVNFNLNPSRKLRDFSAWYHIVFAVDTTQSTASNRVKIYINGSQETVFDTETYPSQNYDMYFNDARPHNIGTNTTGPHFFDGYMAEFCLIDGQQLDPTSFGEFDSDSPNIWKPKNVSGLTFGNNGFYLEFKQSGTGTNSSGIGADTSGNDNHFAVNNLTALDQSTDTCTNNFATLNHLLFHTYSGTYSEGNLKIVASNDSWYADASTIAPSSGKFYMEVKVSAIGNFCALGVGAFPFSNVGHSQLIGELSNTIGWRNNGVLNQNGSAGTSLNSFTTNDIIGMYLDLDNGKFYFSKNGTLESSTGLSLTTGLEYFFVVNPRGSTLELNFGSPPYSVSSSNTDDNGYGNFEYSPNITGDGAAKKFYALNTKNLAEYG